MPSKNRSSRVSVIIPTYNRSNLLRLTVESVLAQTYPNIEIIVVDDDSTDDTAAVMEQYAGRVIYIKQANQGASAARNTGFQAASGEYINFLDDDDLLMPTKIERQVQVLDSHPEIGLVHCGYYHIDADGRPLDRVCMLPAGEVLRELVQHCFLRIHTPLVQRQCLGQVGLFRDELNWHEDWDLWLRIAQAGYQFDCIQEPLCAYRIQGDSKMANPTEVEQGAFTVLDQVFANPGLPVDVRAVEARAYGNTHLWISWSYYVSGRWNDGQRNLAKALTLLPHLLEHPQELLESLIGHALSVRVSDPAKFVSDVLDHLPPCARSLRRYRARLLANVHVGLALRSYASGDLDTARRKIVEALTLRPAMREHPEDFAKLVCHHAVKLPVDAPVFFVETVLRNLPSGAQRLASMRSQILSDVMVACAFEDYYAGRRRSVVPGLLRALRLRPSWLRNRGVVSIFLQSLPAFMRQAYSTG